MNRKYRVLRTDLVKVQNPAMGGQFVEEKSLGDADRVKYLLDQGAIEEIKEKPKPPASGG